MPLTLSADTDVNFLEHFISTKGRKHDWYWNIYKINGCSFDRMAHDSDSETAIKS